MLSVLLNFIHARIGRLAYYIINLHFKQTQGVQLDPMIINATNGVAHRAEILFSSSMEISDILPRNCIQYVLTCPSLFSWSLYLVFDLKINFKCLISRVWLRASIQVVFLSDLASCSLGIARYEWCVSQRRVHFLFILFAELIIINIIISSIILPCSQ